MSRLPTTTIESPNGRVGPEARPVAPRARSGLLAAVRTLLWRLAVSVVIFVAVAELGLRAVDLGHPYESEPDSYLPSDDPEVLFMPRPGYRGFSEGTTVEISSQGLRDREFSPTAPPGTLRILALGDSVTFGTGVLAEQAYPKRLEQALNDRGDGRSYEVVNAGVIGYNTIQERARLEQLGLGLQPDVVLLMFVVNDLLDTFSIFDHQYEPTGLLVEQKKWLRRNSRLVRSYQNVTWRLADYLRKDRDRPELPRDRQRLLEREAEVARVAALSREHGATFLLALYPDNLYQQVTPDENGRQLTVREELLGFAERAGLPVVDLTAAIGDVRDERARYLRLREDPHPSPAGHQAMAEALATALVDDGLLAQ